MNNFDKLYSETYSYIVKYILFRLPNIEDVNDIVQEIYLSLLVDLSKGKVILNARSYVRGIANRKISDYYRKVYKDKERNVPLTFEKDGQEYDYTNLIPGDEELEDEIIEHISIKKILQDINKEDRIGVRIFYLYFYQGLTFREIAKELKMKESTVKYRYKKILDKIRSEYKKEDGVHA